MQRLRAAVVLLLIAAALAPTGSAGTAAAPELTDPAGDQAVQRAVPSQVPPIPSVTDDEFDDVDLVAAWWQERAQDCLGSPQGTCPVVDLVVATTSGWSGGTLTATFRLERGPTSYAYSNASGQAFTLTVTGASPSVSGLANATAAVEADGLRIKLPLARLGAVGGDLLVGLNLTATRTDPGLVTDPQATQDDATGTDTAGPGAAYTVLRPERVDAWSLRILAIDGQAGNRATFSERGDVTIAYEVTNLGTDRAPYVVNIREDEHGLPAFQGVGEAGELDPFQSARHNVTVPMDRAEAGAYEIGFHLQSNPPVTVTLVYAPLAAERGVVPAGLDFLTPAAESTGLDDAFGKYAELALLALIVLVAILLVFLLVALAPSTLAGAAAPEAPPVADAAPEAAPAAVLAPAAAQDAPKPTPPAAAPPAAGPLTIESVTHEPDSPQEGEPVRTVVVVRNPGATRQVRVVLSRDEQDEDDKAVTLPARATKTVTLGWVAGPGENKVRVRVLPA